MLRCWTSSSYFQPVCVLSYSFAALIRVLCDFFQMCNQATKGEQICRHNFAGENTQDDVAAVVSTAAWCQYSSLLQCSYSFSSAPAHSGISDMRVLGDLFANYKYCINASSAGLGQDGDTPAETRELRSAASCWLEYSAETIKCKSPKKKPALYIVTFKLHSCIWAQAFIATFSCSSEIR